MQASGDNTTEVAVSHLRFGLSPRKHPFDEHHVALLAGVLPQVPPIMVHEPTMQVIDGVHRVMAARSLGQATIRATLFRGSEAQAAILAIHRNVTHGKPLTSKERETAALDLLRNHAQWSDRRIALLCGISSKTVAGLRYRATAELPQSPARVGRDGRARPVDPVELRQRVAHTIGANPAASIRAVAALTGASQATVRDVRDRLRRGDHILPPRLVRKYEAQRAPSSPTSLSSPSSPSSPSGLDDPSGLNGPSDDRAYASLPERHQFKRWFESHVLSSDSDWEPFVSAVPVSRVYEVADAARRCAEVWRRFAGAVEARSHRRDTAEGSRRQGAH